MPMMKTAGIFLEDFRLALLSRQIGIHVQNLFGVEEGQLVGHVGIFVGLQLGEELLDVVFRALENLPNFPDDVLRGIRGSAPWL